MNYMTMPKEIISNWEPRHEMLFGNNAIKLNHRLGDTGLFTREALAKLIERCPVEELDIAARSPEKDNPKRLLGLRGNASGEETIAAIERGKMWMNIRRVMEWDPQYRDLLDKVFDELQNRIPGFKTSKRNLGVLISSPNQKVYYHTDIQGQSLWQISGSKRLYLYPITGIFAQPRSIEATLLRETDDMPYQNWFDEFATPYDLVPGEMLTWPLYAPHRVENHNSLNISVTMEHWTQEIWNAYAVNYGNGVLRRTFGLKNLSTRYRGAHVYPKAAAAYVWKKLGKQPGGDLIKERSFKIDASSPEGRVAI